MVRGPKREIISRCYNLLLRLTLRVGFSDAQCGFKAVRACPARELLPLAEFEAMVAKGEVHYYVGESNNSFGGGSGSSSIASWVAAHFKSQTVGGTTVYNLTQAK